LKGINSRPELPPTRRKTAFTLLELLLAIAIMVTLAGLVFVVGKKVYASSSLAVSASNIRQLAAGGMAYLGDNNYFFWPYSVDSPANPRDRIWWFGLEREDSLGKPEGQRDFDATLGPLANYLPKGFRPDPSFSMQGRAFKPKYRFGYIGIAYNTLLGGGFYPSREMRSYHSLPDPTRVVVFATSAQINDFQSPASRRNPMIEEFYALDEGKGSQARYPNVHFRHNGKAMVAFATGNAGFLPMEESTRDRRNPAANVGRLAPNGSTRFLE
jgi:hypothetical protein